jgi:hypothetical protein
MRRLWKKTCALIHASGSLRLSKQHLANAQLELDSAKSNVITMVGTLAGDTQPALSERRFFQLVCERSFSWGALLRLPPFLFIRD